jgi:hypothetical protein
MSLKTFHLIFISSASAMALGCGVWELKDYWSGAGGTTELGFGLGSVAAAVGLVLYERYFLKKLKKVDSL